ncbi:MAG TPA: hypothetical protein VLE53_15430 [Gemmatimonadaceae bacterium]|nr:hypothetical protein [Gemmatimonadaceae bacterium]
MTLLALLFTLTASAAVVVAAGTHLARSADAIAARTNLGGAWIGSVFLAVATSLPEITTDVAAVRLGAPDLAAGDLFGSSMANMLILAVVSLLPTGTELFRKATLDHLQYAALAIILTAMAAVFVLVRPATSFLGVGAGSLALLLVFLVGSRAVFRATTVARRAGVTEEMSERPDGAGAPPRRRVQLEEIRRPLIAFSVAALVILVTAPLFAHSAEGLAEISGLGSTFMGTWLVGLSTSLPELVTSLAAVRMRAYDLAVGNLFGSNTFNMVIFVVLDLAQGSGPFFAVISQVHALSALVAIALMALGAAALVVRAQGRLTLLEPSSALIVLGYLLGLAVVLAESTVW